MNYFLGLLKNLDKKIILIIGLLATISLVIIYSVTYPDGFVLNSSLRDIIIQALAYVLGGICAIIILMIDYKSYSHFEKFLYIASILILLTVYIPGLGYEQYGARSWIRIPGVTTLQPSEFVKLSFAILMAMYLSKNRDNLDTFKGIFMAFLYGAPFIIIVVKEDLGSAIVYCAMWALMVFYAGIDYKLLLKLFLAFCACVPVMFLVMADHQKDRILAFLHPNDLSLPGNYHVWMSKIAIGSGGLFGKGLFNGTQKELDFLPVQKSDFIFSVICEELGLIGGLVVILLFTVLLYRFAVIARDAIDLYGALIVIGLIGMFGFQIFENIAMTMGIMPVTGITLPFLSYGGSAILSNMAAVGLILCVGIRSKQINF
ncbi:MAG: rod shape-determining protein RodA [Firmicutes bacterium]|nr:rod shape-determining protein RodA [Bacillota bacterium]MBQ9973032.1 rod shape-determining protein RodA [Bacillota bacterium]